MAPQQPPRDQRLAPRVVGTLEVEILGRGSGEHLLTRDLSPGGAFIVTPKVVPINQIIRLRVFTPPPAIDMMVRVLHVVTPTEGTEERPAGMGVAIFSISDTDRLRWNDLVALCGQEAEDTRGAHAIRSHTSGNWIAVDNSLNSATRLPRRHFRVDTRLEVRIRDMKSLFRFVSRDISAGGVFVETDQRVLPDEVIELAVCHPISGESFPLEGRVVRIEGRGVAIEFTRLSDEDRRWLQRFIMTGRAPA
jgi:Tfp pilus assembly protein PilZ